MRTLSTTIDNSKEPHVASSTEFAIKKTEREGGLFRLFSDEERRLLREQKSLCRRAQHLVQTIEAYDPEQAQSKSPSTKARMSHMNQAAASTLEEQSTFCLVFAGEFNAGKSSCINALVGEKLLEMGTIPTTDCITILSAQRDDSKDEHDSPNNDQQASDNTHSSDRSPEIKVQSSSLIELHNIPSDTPLLQDVTIVDTPGTNAVWLDHTETTLNLLPAADMILFVTSADRPLSQSERTLLQSIVNHYRKPVVILLNKMDLLEMAGGDHGQTEKKRVTEFVLQQTQEFLGRHGDAIPPTVLPISARDALAAKQLHQQSAVQQSASSSLQDSALWKRSNFQALHDFLQNTLTKDTKIKSKLLSPIGEAERIVHSALDQLKAQQEALAQDLATLQLVQSQLQGWRNSIDQEMKSAHQELCGPLELESKRASRFLQRNSLWQLMQWSLFSNFDNTYHHRLHTAWDNTQSSYSSNSLKEEMNILGQEIADSVATQGRAQGQAIIEFLGKRPGSRNQSLVGNVLAASRFEETKKSLSEQVSRVLERHIPEENEVSHTFLSTLKRSVHLGTALQAGSAISAVLTYGSFLDVFTGSSSTLTLGAAGGWILSQGRWRAAREFEEMWSQHREQLSDALGRIFEKELDRVDRRIRDGIKPYTGSVQAEQERTNHLSKDCEEILTEAHRLRRRIKQAS